MHSYTTTVLQFREPGLCNTTQVNTQPYKPAPSCGCHWSATSQHIQLAVGPHQIVEIPSNKLLSYPHPQLQYCGHHHTCNSDCLSFIVLAFTLSVIGEKRVHMPVTPAATTACTGSLVTAAGTQWRVPDCAAAPVLLLLRPLSHMQHCTATASLWYCKGPAAVAALWYVYQSHACLLQGGWIPSTLPQPV